MLLTLAMVACASGPASGPSSSPVPASAHATTVVTTSLSAAPSPTPSATLAATPATPSPSPTPAPATPSPAPSTATYPRLFPLSADIYDPDGGIGEPVFVYPRSDPGTAELKKRYQHQLGHCGISNGIDFDGSFWDVVGAQDGQGHPVAENSPQSSELINDTKGTMSLIGVDQALFRGPSGLILGLGRHDGPKGFRGGCA
jgi:hypothetical protein